MLQIFQSSLTLVSFIANTFTLSFPLLSILIASKTSSLIAAPASQFHTAMSVRFTYGTIALEVTLNESPSKTAR